MITEFEKKDVKPNLYSYKEIKLATKNFDKKNKLGEGGFGVVYKVRYIYIDTCFIFSPCLSSRKNLNFNNNSRHFPFEIKLQLDF